MTEILHKGRVFSFWKLLSETRVEVPIIQRDYAQGRIDEQEIRDNFLNALYSSLSESKYIKLDFIYGSIEKGIFQPLDGQQRLTTLFLLHWYAFIKENNLHEKRKSVLLQFTYENRITSREFCEALIINPVEINNSIDKIRDKIVDSSWFVLSWEKDPTIDAMLRTIDDIHSRFYNVPNLLEKLTEDNCLITFYHVELRNIGLTDDLYIKMNARGKLLSPFENFKASLQKQVNDNEWEDGVEFTETFACKIDTTWTDLFWSHRKENSIDEAFMRFASTIAMIRQSLDRLEHRIATISALQENPNSLRPEVITSTAFKYLKDCFNIYTKVLSTDYDLTLNFNLWQHTPKNNIFSALVYEDNESSNLQKNSATYTQKVLFFAQTEYLRRARQFNSLMFQDWMRVIRNIISRGDITKYGDRPTIIRSPQTFDGVINLVNELAEGCEDICKFLANLTSPRSSFAKDQVEEEILKARIISSYPEQKKLILALEDNNLLRGKISFALYCVNFQKDISKLDFIELNKVEVVFNKYFNSESEIPNLLRRALLTIDDNGQYKYYEYWWSFWNVVSADKRCLIDKYRELEYYIYSDYKIYFKKLISKLFNDDYRVIIDKFVPPNSMPNWKVRLIKDPDLLDNYCRSHYIAIAQDESCCYLLKSMRPRDMNGCEEIR